MAITLKTDASSILRRKIEDIKNLIQHADKDSTLRSDLEAQFISVLEQQDNILCKPVWGSGTAKRQKVVWLLNKLTVFKRSVISQITKSSVILSPIVTLPRLSRTDIQMSLGQKRLSTQDNGNGTHDSNSDSEDNIFIPVKKGTNGFNSASPLPEKRVRKQVVRPDFVSTFKKAKMENSKDEDMHEGASSNEGESSTPTSNGGYGQGPTFPCPVCKKIFRKKGHMTRHLLTHEPEKPFGCDFCSKRFAAKYSLQMHLLNRHNTDAKPFECQHCDRRFTLKKELDQHVLSHKEGFKPRSFQCHLCELKFITQGDLDSHLESHPEAEIYNCGHCDKSFPRRYNLIRHERTHSDIKQYHCSVCNKEFGTKNGLTLHLASHENDGNKPLSCHLCGKKFSVEQNLELHITYHNQSDDKPYNCELCEVRFKSQERLDRHFETHGSIEGRIYPCQYCDKTFPRKYNLIRHELSHTHGRRKPKDGMPTPRERHETNGRVNGGGSDDESMPATTTTTTTKYADDHSTVPLESVQENSNCNFVYSSVTKSDLFATFFGFEEPETMSEDCPPPFIAEHYSIVKFENY